MVAAGPGEEPTVHPANLPPGWAATQRTPETWSLTRRGEVVAELVLSLVGTWRYCPAGEILPRPQAYPTPADAVAALLGISPRLATRPSPIPREHRTSEPDPSATPRPVIGSYYTRTAPAPRHREPRILQGGRSDGES